MYEVMVNNKVLGVEDNIEDAFAACLELLTHFEHDDRIEKCSRLLQINHMCMTRGGVIIAFRECQKAEIKTNNKKLRIIWKEWKSNPIGYGGHGIDVFDT